MMYEGGRGLADRLHGVRENLHEVSECMKANPIDTICGLGYFALERVLAGYTVEGKPRLVRYLPERYN